MKIKKQPSLRALRTRAWCLKVLAAVFPIRFVRRSHLKAYYRVWDAEISAHAVPDPEDVYEAGIQWSRKPLPAKEADRLLALHDADLEEEALSFQHTLEENLRRGH